MAVPPPYASSSTAPAPATEAADVFPPLRTADVLACQFSSWYPLFKRHAPKATVIRPIPQEEEFLEYLESDGLILPEGSGPMGVSELSDSEDEEEEERDPDSDSDDDEPPKQFAFPHLDAEIRSVLARYDGAVFPKLNWSSPQDAAWMLPGQNLKCQTPGDVYLLLKSSDFISHDLDHAFAGCIDYSPSSSASAPTLPPPSSAPNSDFAPPPELNEEDLARLTLSGSSDSPDSKRPYQFELVLKKWFDMPKSQEWRCFVRESVFVGISHRDTTFYDFLQPAQVQEDLCDLITSFWEDELRDKAPLQSYAFDIYLTRDNSRVFLIDFNPFSRATDPLLFDYLELDSLFRSHRPSATASSFSSSPPAPTLPVLRLVTSEVQAARSMPRYSHNRYPKDVVDLSEGQSIAEFAKEWMGKVAEAAVGDEAPLAAKNGAAGKEEERVGR
ncbi:hypothetical protein JCM6882_009316 [Rhodosporidiobolus microsporus]